LYVTPLVVVGTPNRSGVGPLAHYRKTAIVHFDIDNDQEEIEGGDENAMAISSPQPQRATSSSTTSISPAEKARVQVDIA